MSEKKNVLFLYEILTRKRKRNSKFDQILYISLKNRTKHDLKIQFENSTTLKVVETNFYLHMRNFCEVCEDNHE